MNSAEAVDAWAIARWVRDDVGGMTNEEIFEVCDDAHWAEKTTGNNEYLFDRDKALNGIRYLLTQCGELKRP